MCSVKKLNNSRKQQNISNYFANLSVPPDSTASTSHLQVPVPSPQVSASHFVIQQSTTPHNQPQQVATRPSRPVTLSIDLTRVHFKLLESIVHGCSSTDPCARKSQNRSLTTIYWRYHPRGFIRTGYVRQNNYCRGLQPVSFKGQTGGNK